MTDPPPFAELAPRAHGAAVAALPAGLAATARAVIAVADQALDAVAGDPAWRDKLAGLACAAGCSFCCHQLVGVTPAEAALLAEGVAALGAARRKRFVRRARSLAAQAVGLDQRRYWAAKLPCAALDDDGRCLLHAFRPLPCRGYNSANAELCRRSLDGEAVRVPVLAAQFTIYGHAQAGLAQALAAAGIDPGPVALVEVLGRPATAPA